MNALTKAFVVVVTILSVVMVALVVPFAARVPDYASQFKQMEQQYEARLSAATDTATEIRNAIAAKGSDLESALESITALTSELDQANTANKALETKLAQFQLTLSNNSTAMQIAAAEGKAKTDQLSVINKLVNEQLAVIGDLQSQRSDLSQTLIDERFKVRRLTDNYLRIQEENRALSQQLLETTAKLTIAHERLAALVDNVDEVLAGPGKPVVEILGSVTQIEQITDGIVLVQVNIGTRDLVQEGMEFTVSRGDEFIGKIQIASVDTAASVGQLTLGGGIQEGDNVRAGGR